MRDGPRRRATAAVDRPRCPRGPCAAAQRARWRRLVPCLTLVLAAAPGCASADWIDRGLAWRCDAASGVFSLMATMATSAPETAGEVRAAAGHEALSKAHADTVLSCRIGRFQASAAVRVIGAQAHGRCSEFDVVQIARLEADGRSLMRHEPFSGGGNVEPVLHRIEIRAEGDALWLRTCRAPWDWASGYAPDACDEREVSNAVDAGSK